MTLEPCDVWLHAEGPHLSRSAKIDILRGRARVRVYEGTTEVGIGYGMTVEEAAANAMNSVFARQYEGEACDDECDRIYEQERLAQ